MPTTSNNTLMNNKFINNIKIVCRACLSSEDSSIQTSLKDDIKLMFMDCTSLEISPEDELPLIICSKCLNHLFSWLSFKQQCEESDNILRNFLVKKNTEINHDDEDSSKDILQENTIIPLNNAKPVSTNDSSSEILFQQSELTTQQEHEQLSSPDILYEDSLDLSEDENGSKIQFINQEQDEHKQQPTIIKNPRETPKSTKKKRILCPVCGKMCQNEERLAAHNRLHSGLKPEICKVCAKEFDNLRALRRHQTKHENSKPHTCNECEKSYKYANSLRLHRKLHQNYPTFVCDYCGKSFYRAHGLQSHLISHSTETPFSCDICGKQFKSKTMLKNHRIRHEGIKKFICSECGKTFTTSAELVTHSRAHSGIKPFGCTLCEKKYKTKSHLAVHMRHHTGSRPYACDLCPQSFAHNKVLKQHRLTHTGERPHICIICNRPFRQKSTLQVHMKTHKNQQDDLTISLEVLEQEGGAKDENKFITSITLA